MSPKHEAEPAQPSLQTAFDVMTQDVVSVPTGTTVGQVASVLVEKRISAVPVVDEAGNLVGIVSEGDLLGRNQGDRIAGRDWWLDMLADEAQGITIDAEHRARRVEDVMHAPVVTVVPNTPIPEIADMLQSHRIKRVVVVDDTRPIGIVSRADLLRATAVPPASNPSSQPSPLTNLLTSFFGSERHDRAPVAQPSPTSAPARQEPAPATAQAFHELVEASKYAAAADRERAIEDAELTRRRKVKETLEDHLDAEMWASLLDHARQAAERGENEFQLLRFPSAVCSDGGRRVGVQDHGWETTLRGEAADLYDRWERDLKAKGFGLSARVLDYPQGMPGDIGLFLTWA